MPSPSDPTKDAVCTPSATEPNVRAQAAPRVTPRPPSAKAFSPVAHTEPAQGRSPGDWVANRLGPDLLRFAGAILLMAAAGLWITPEGLQDAELALLKLGTSIIFACLGLVLLTAGRGAGTDEFHVDAGKREIRHVLRGADGIARLQARYRFGDLADVRLDNRMVMARDHHGRLVLNRPVAALDLGKAIASACHSGLLRKV